MNESILIDFNLLAENVISAAKSYSIKLKDLPEVHLKLDIRNHSYFKTIFTELDQKKKHCLYWFEFDTNESSTTINNLLNESRISLSERMRVVPVKNLNSESNVLYVGIRRGGNRKYDNLSNISGRLIQHLGYYHVGSTQGLQFAYWANKSDIELNFKVVEFENLPNLYLEMLEKLIAYKLKPLCGKH